MLVLVLAFSSRTFYLCLVKYAPCLPPRRRREVSDSILLRFINYQFHCSTQKYLDLGLGLGISWFSTIFMLNKILFSKTEEEQPPPPAVEYGPDFFKIPAFTGIYFFLSWGWKKMCFSKNAHVRVDKGCREHDFSASGVQNQTWPNIEDRTKLDLSWQVCAGTR